MSFYEYHEFQAVDRPLTEREMLALRAVSSRATITCTRFTNHYEWGSFKGDPSAWMEKYFDAYLYFGNWTIGEFMLRLPRRVLDPRTARRYCRGGSAQVRVKGDCVILGFATEDDGDPFDGMDDGSGWLSALLPLREDIASGDHRALYLAWLHAAQGGELERDQREPQVPPGLGSLHPPLESLADFLRLDRDLISAAAQRSARAEAAPSRRQLERWVAALPEVEKNRLLVQVAAGEVRHPRGELLRRLSAVREQASARTPPGRTVGRLLAAAARRPRR